MQAQTIYNEIPQAAYDNFSDAYNYTFWDDNFLTPSVSPRKFSIQTSSFGLNINYDDLMIDNLTINQKDGSAAAAFATSKTSIFPASQGGNINYFITQNGTILYQKSTTPTSFGNKDSQMAEYGTWLNRRFVSTHFTNGSPFVPYFTGIEFTNWHNRLKMTLHVRPTINIVDGQLLLTVEIPSIYSEQLTDGTLYAFSDETDAGFAVKGGTALANVSRSGNTMAIITHPQTLVANTSYEVSLVFYAAKENLSTTYPSLAAEETAITIQATQNLPDANGTPTTNYVPEEGIHYIDVPRYWMGYNNCGLAERLQNIELALQNTSATDKRVRLCFRQIPDVNVVGFNSMLRNNNGDPSGFPLQVSKNWHTEAQLFSGTWIREYTELIIPANSTLNFDYTRTGAKWGETYSASSHQLSVAGAGVPKGGWLEAALGSFGESITHSPDYRYGNSNICDYRPFMVTNEAYQGTSKECFWTGNVGGMDMWVYTDDTNKRIYQSQVKTRFQRYSPNLTETSISAYSSDNKLKLDYTFYLNRSDDYIRVYYKIKLKALENTPFNRFDIFQMGGDIYNLYRAQTVYYGNYDGVQGQFHPTNSGTNNYTNNAIPLTGSHPWIWAGNGTITNGFGGINIETNNGIIIRDYKAKLGGTASNIPYFRERSSSQGFSASSGQHPTSYCLVSPPDITSFTAGDSIELVLETVILPKQDGDYYGPNANFMAALATHGNSVDLFLREVQGNKVELSSPTNTVSSTYPFSVLTANNTAGVTVKNGRSYVPIIFKGLTNVTNPTLWKTDNTGNNCWQVVDQSTWGKDFWQADYQAATGLYDLIYNVNQDIAGDGSATISYYLGESPPTPSIIVQTKRNEEPWTINSTVEVALGGDVHFAPQVEEGGTVSPGLGQWTWVGPNGFVASSRYIELAAITESDLGMYTVTYTSPYSCTSTQEFELACLDQDEDGTCDVVINPCADYSETPFQLADSHLINENFKTSASIESTATIGSGLIVNYEAGQFINLKTGFHAATGSIFSAIIKDCTSETIHAPTFDTTLRTTRDNMVNAVRIFPNPFKETVEIDYTLTAATSLQIRITDFTGKQIATLVDTDYQEAGTYRIPWQKLPTCAPGMLLLSIKTDQGVLAKKMVVGY